MDKKLGVIFEFVVGVIEALKDGKVDAMEAQEMLSTMLRGSSIFSGKPIEREVADRWASELVEAGAVMTEIFNHFKEG